MELHEIKSRIAAAIDAAEAQIAEIAKKILENPEVGYSEHATSALVRSVLDELSIPYEYPLALTGVKATLKGRRSDFNVCIMGELDAVRCVGHPHAAADGAAHACGHNAQIAAMLGAAIGLARSGVMTELDGDVTFIAAPAEEFIDMDFRKSLRDAGKIAYFGGKQQLIAEGAFDDVDMAMMVHAQPNEPAAKAYTRGHNLGFLAKSITFGGKAAHGSKPYEGTNALNAACLAILGVHANRETFRDEDRIRIHPIITKGGDVVNSVPDEVCIDTYVRGATPDAIKKGDAAVERAIHGAADMIGATVSVENTPGYLPIHEDPTLSEVFERNVIAYAGEGSVIQGGEITGSTDVGDLSQIMPVIQPSMGGFNGNLHAREFAVCDAATAYLLPAKVMASTAAELLADGAASAKNVVENFHAGMEKEEYIEYLKGK